MAQFSERWSTNLSYMCYCEPDDVYWRVLITIAPFSIIITIIKERCGLVSLPSTCVTMILFFTLGEIPVLEVPAMLTKGVFFISLHSLSWNTFRLENTIRNSSSLNDALSLKSYVNIFWTFVEIQNEGSYFCLISVFGYLARPFEVIQDPQSRRK